MPDKSVTMKAALSSNCLGPSPTSLFWVVLNVLVPNVADGMGEAVLRPTLNLDGWLI